MILGAVGSSSRSRVHGGTTLSDEISMMELTMCAAGHENRMKDNERRIMKNLKQKKWTLNRLK